MKKLNNKGFAISTIIYGISIMGIMLIAMLMANMSAIRKNNNDFAKTIEEDLTRFSMAESTFGKSVDAEGNTDFQTYTVPEGESGWYKIELWGAQGGNGSGGRGAYTSGVIHLNAGEKLYFYVGKMGGAGLGGESTEVRVLNSNYLNPNNDRIMVAAGGGANSGADGGTLYGQNSNMVSLGGVLNITQGTYELTSKTLIGYPETGYPSSTGDPGLPHVSAADGFAGDSSPKKSDGGGYGYKGGDSANVGGASCIAGAAGCFGPVTASVNGESRVFYFLDSMMLAGVREGDGQARVSKVYVGDNLTRKNSKLNNVSKIVDCIGTANSQATALRGATQLDVRSGGVSIGYNRVNSTDTNSLCTTFTLDGGAQNIDELAIWHTSNQIGGIDVVNHRIFAIDSSGQSQAIKDYISSPDSSTTKYNLPSETETPAGIRISAYQHDGTQNIPDVGDYYIIPIITENKVMSARQNEVDDANAILYEYYNGDNRQKWSIEKIFDTRVSPDPTNKPEYKIVELARYKALAVTLDENMIKNTVSTLSTFNSYARNEPQLWKVYSLGDGTYAISTVVDYFRDNVPTGGLVAQTRYDDGSTPSEPSIIISQNKDSSNRRKFSTQRFKLIDINYG